MITEAEAREIEELVKRFPVRKAACIEALQVIQKRRGWVSEENLRDVARILDMTPEELSGVATFYSQVYQKPVGRHVILICDSISCWVMGYENVRDHLTSRLEIRPGGTTPDGRFTILPIPCLGACDHAPAMMIDDDLHGDLTPEKIDAILERYK